MIVMSYDYVRPPRSESAYGDDVLDGAGEQDCTSYVRDFFNDSFSRCHRRDARPMHAWVTASYSKPGLHKTGNTSMTRGA